ncbi:MAG TPA: hypothetical protein VFJ17_02280 [Mycobacteriales bacterium]|jgi:hypothetical protein|nr:hypothetical protein [Mycobacteriales bacterium]
MATVAVPAAWIAQGTLPPCCARHGGPATRQAKRRFDTKTPSWVLLLVLVALLIAVIVALAIRKSVQGQMPECEQCVQEQRRFKLTVLGAWVADVVLLVLAANLGAAGLLLWLVATLAALIWSFAGGQRYRVHGYLSKDQMWVELRGASDEFAAAINAVVRPGQPVAPSEPVAPPVAAPQSVAAAQPVAPPQPVAAEPVAPAQPIIPTQPVVAAEPVAPPQPVVAPEPVAAPQAVTPPAPVVPEPAPVVSEPEPEPELVAAEPIFTGLPTRPTVLPAAGRRKRG